MIADTMEGDIFKRSLTSGEIQVVGLQGSPLVKKQRASRTVSDSAVPVRLKADEDLLGRAETFYRSDLHGSEQRLASRELSSRGNVLRSTSRELESRGREYNLQSPEKSLSSPAGFTIALGTSRLARAIGQRQGLSESFNGSESSTVFDNMNDGIKRVSNNNNNEMKSKSNKSDFTTVTDKSIDTIDEYKPLDKKSKWGASKKMSFRKIVNLAHKTTGLFGSFRKTNSRRQIARHHSMDESLLVGAGSLKRQSTQGAFRTWQIDESLNRFSEYGEAVGFFKRMVRRCLNCLFWIQLLSNEEEKQLKTFVDLAKEIEEISFPSGMKEAGLAFDKNYFKANREINLSSDVMRILTFNAASRTPEMVQQVMAGLQTLRSFAEYPLHMQAKLAQVAWYQVVPQKKMVIRQGHEAQNFYFVLGGQAIMKSIKTDSSGDTYMAIVGRLTKGSSFGEVALLHQTTRECTVQTVTPMQLLVIYRDDFFRIFMSRGDQNISEPDHVTFCRKNVDFLRDWPVDLLLNDDNEGECLFHFFRRGQVVIEDSNKCDWIYIVKSGTCAVMKQLHRVEPRSPRELEKEYKRLHVRKPGSLPRIGTSEPGPRIDSWRPYQPKLSLPELPDIKMKEQTVKAVSDLFKSVLANKKDVGKLPRVDIDDDRNNKPRTRVTFNIDVKEDEDKESDNLPPEPKPEKKFFNPINYDEEILAKLNLSRPSTARSVAATPPPIPAIHSEGSLGMPGYSKSKMDFFPCLSKSHISSQTSAPPKLKTRPSLSRSHSRIFTELDEEEGHISRPRSNKRSASMNDLRFQSGRSKSWISDSSFSDSIFVQVGLLKPKDSFGLEFIQFDDEVETEHPKLSLVSRGAELIMISKKFFVKHCGEATRQWLREKVRPYPGDASLQTNLQTKTDWELYKHILLDSYIEGHDDDS